ncbi:MAG: dipicolinate synthase subunit DpsA, partial [Ignavibacteriales bacterium]
AVYTEDKIQLTEKSLRGMAASGLIIIGTARPFLTEWSANLGLNLMQIGDMDEVAILNSIPTAEGAVQIAMEEMDSTIHGCNAVVLGCGRVGTTLARLLKNLGAYVTVVSRERAELARAYEIGCQRVELQNIAEVVIGADVIFNTIPAVVLGTEILRRLSYDTLIIDLASAPGGTDFETANDCGIKAILAPGLPGKVAPQMAGKILADVVPRLLIESMTKAGQKLLLA